MCHSKLKVMVQTIKKTPLRAIMQFRGFMDSHGQGRQKHTLCVSHGSLFSSIRRFGRGM